MARLARVWFNPQQEPAPHTSNRNTHTRGYARMSACCLVNNAGAYRSKTVGHRRRRRKERRVPAREVSACVCVCVSVQRVCLIAISNCNRSYYMNITPSDCVCGVRCASASSGAQRLPTKIRRRRAPGELAHANCLLDRACAALANEIWASN